jgi:hypothetical protein
VELISPEPDDKKSESTASAHFNATLAQKEQASHAKSLTFVYMQTDDSRLCVEKMNNIISHVMNTARAKWHCCPFLQIQFPNREKPT